MKGSKQTQRDSYLSFVFFRIPGGVCVRWVGHCDIDVIWLHLHFRNNMCPSVGGTIPYRPLSTCVGCRANGGNPALILPGGGRTWLYEKNQHRPGQETPLREDHLEVKAQGCPRQLLLQKGTEIHLLLSATRPHGAGKALEAVQEEGGRLQGSLLSRSPPRAPCAQDSGTGALLPADCTSGFLPGCF